ncbi:MAG TPA: hypothetical protein VGC61_07970 [Pyrinomonadaceae bacterium]
METPVRRTEAGAGEGLEASGWDEECGADEGHRGDCMVVLAFMSDSLAQNVTADSSASTVMSQGIRKAKRNP